MQKYQQYLILSLILILSPVNPVLALKDKAESFMDYHNKGNNLAQSDKYELALKAYDKAIELNPDDFGAYTNKGNVLYKLNKYDLAIEAYNKAIGLDPTNAIVQRNKQLLLQRIRGALRLFK